MSGTFSPPDQIEVMCRFCQKILPAQLDRSIAGNGRTVDRSSTFEYCCSKCSKTFCLSGNDLKEVLQPESIEEQAREYLPNEHFYIGEVIRHKKFKEEGLVVGKDAGSPNRILVQFKKLGLKKLVEGFRAS